MVRIRKGIYVGNQEVQRRYIGNKLIFEIVVDMDDKVKVSGTEIFTDKADNSVVHVEVDGVIGGLNNFDVVSSVGGKNLISHNYENYMRSLYAYAELSDKEEPFILKLYEKDSTVNMSGIYFGFTEAGINGDLKVQWAYSAGVRSTVLTDNLELIASADMRFFSFYPSTKSAWDRILSRYDIKVERGNVATDWTPAPEDITENDNHPLIDKINISLSEPLRAVGDVKDRLFRDNDGLWKVEWNVNTSGVETLSQDLQDKLNNLRSFQGSNYVYTISNTDISPTLHATFKSKGWYDNYQNTLLK